MSILDKILVTGEVQLPARFAKYINEESAWCDLDLCSP